jgi:hypothetical protein
MPLTRRIGLAVIGLTMLACSDSPSGPTTPTIPDAATLLAEMSSSSIGAAEALAGSSNVNVPLAMSGADPRTCAYNEATGFFVCPTVTAGSLTISRMYRFIDAAGNSQSKPDAQTSAFETKTSVSGTITSTTTEPRTSTGSYTINSVSDETLSDLRAEHHTLNGVTTTTIQGTLQAGGTTLPLDEHLKETTSNLVLPNARKGEKWPLSGTITVEDTTNNFDPFTPTATYSTTITFHGTSKVTFTFSGPFGSSSCTVDLAGAPGTGFGGCTP